MKPRVIFALLCLATLSRAYQARAYDTSEANVPGESLDNTIDRLTHVFNHRLKQAVSAGCEQQCARSQQADAAPDGASPTTGASVMPIKRFLGVNGGMPALRVPAFPGSYGLQAYVNMSKFRWGRLRWSGSLDEYQSQAMAGDCACNSVQAGCKCSGDPMQDRLQRWCTSWHHHERHC
jgi:hypothetical protein